MTDPTDVDARVTACFRGRRFVTLAVPGVRWTEHMSHYFDSDDKKYTRVYKRETPDILDAFTAFNDAVFATEGREIPLKYRELIAVAVAFTTQCVYCIDGHSKSAVRAGATEGELAEAAWVASALRAGASYTHGRLAFKLVENEHEHAH